MNRLETIAPDFAQFLKEADPDTRSLLKREACREILPFLEGIEDEAVESAKLQIFYKDKMPAELRIQLENLADSYDEKYFPLFEGDPDNEAAYMPYFTKARALSALSSAGEGDSYECTADAIYEVSSALMDRNELFDRLRKVIEG